MKLNTDKLLNLTQVRKYIRERVRGKFYTYILFRSNNVPFYVGYGQRYRISFHEKQAFDNPDDSMKVRAILKIWRQHKEVKYLITNIYKNRISAQKQETYFIKKIGRKDLNRGPLANLSDGGEGINRSQIVKNKQSKTMKKVSTKKKKEDPKSWNEWLEKLKKTKEQKKILSRLTKGFIKNNPEKYQEIQDKATKAKQTKKWRKAQSERKKKFIKENPEKFLAIIKKSNLAKQNPEFKNKQSLATKKWNEENPELLKRKEKKRIKSFRKYAIGKRIITKKELKERFEKGQTQIEIARDLGVSHERLYDYVKNVYKLKPFKKEVNAKKFKCKQCGKTFAKKVYGKKKRPKFCSRKCTNKSFRK